MVSTRDAVARRGGKQRWLVRFRFKPAGPIQDTHIGDSPISRLAEQVAVDPIGFDWSARHRDRMWTNRQARLRLYKHRFFTTGQVLTQDNNLCDVSVSSCYTVVLLSVDVLAWSSRPPACEAKAALDPSSLSSLI